MALIVLSVMVSIQQRSFQWERSLVGEESMDVKIEELYSAVSALHCVRKPKLLCSIIHYMPRFCKSLLQNLQLQIKSKSLLNVMSGNYLDLLLCDIEA